MSDSLINTRRRINTIKSTEKITKAMKLVASVKFQRVKKNYQDNEPFYTGVNETFKWVLENTDLEEAKKNCLILSENQDSEKTLYIVVTSTLGLCGAYNYNIFKMLDPLLKAEDEVLCIGQKGWIHYKEEEMTSNEDYVSLLDTSNFTFGKVKGLRHQLIRSFNAKKYKAIYLVYTSYKNSLTFLPTLKKLLPLDLSGFDLPKEKPFAYPPIMEPSQTNVLTEYLPHYLDNEIYRKLLETELSELASRRNAMETATDSADKIVNQLMITYNKSRQNAITQEITEVVAGANAGKDEDN